MCGRYASFRDAQDLADAFAVAPPDVAEDARLLPPSWNVAPTDAVRVVVERVPKATSQGRDGTGRGDGSDGSDDGTDGSDDGADATGPEPVRSLRLARWGLVPGWAKDPSVGSRMINARVETVTTKPAFRRAAASRRCLVPAEGYYEWQTLPDDAPGPAAPTGRAGRGTRGRPRKQPFWIHRADGGPLAFAGLYEFWRDPSRADDDPGRWLVTVTIVTGGAPTDDPALAEIHDRQPVMLDPSRWDAWLDPALTDPDRVQDLLARSVGTAPGLVAVPVSTDVNAVANDGPHLVEPVETEVPLTLDLG